MKIFFSSKTKLIKTAEDTRGCRLCSTPSTKNFGSLPVVPYSLIGEPTANKIRKQEMPGCTTCNTTGKIKAGSPTYRECKTCKEGAITPGGTGQGPGLYKPKVCPTCYNQGKRLVPVHGGSRDEFEEIPCPTCHGNKDEIPVKECPTCKESDKPGFVQTGESEHDILCPTCKGSKTHITAQPYTPILQVKCPHLNGVDTFTKPNAEGANDELGPYDKNYFEGQRLIPLTLLRNIRGVGSKYSPKKERSIAGFDLESGAPREVGILTPPLPPVASSKEPSYLDFFSRTDLLDPEHQRTASNLFKNINKYFNSKTAKPNIPTEPDQPSSSTGNDEPEDFFGGSQSSAQTEANDLSDFIPEDVTLAPLTPSQRTLTPEQQKRLHGGPVTVRKVDESDMLRSYLKNPSRAIEKTKSILRGQRTLEEKRTDMSKKFKRMKDLERKTMPQASDSEERKIAKAKERSGGLRPDYRGWRDNLQKVSENLDIFGSLRSSIRNQISTLIGKRVNPDVATALTHKVFREGKRAKFQTEEGGETKVNRVDLSQHNLGITEPMPYFKNDENWREAHHGFGCDHDPSGKHEPDVGCIVDYHNPAENPREGITTGINSRLVTGKYTSPEGKTVLQTVGARLKRVRESGVPKQELRGLIPQWTPENFGRVVELPADRATCVPNRIQKEHYVVDHTVEPPTERTSYVSLPPEESGMSGLSPEPVINKEKIHFPEEIRQGGPTESVYVGNPLYQLSNPFSSQEVERGMWANNPAVQHLAKQIKGDEVPEKFKPYVPEPKFNSQKMKTRPGLTGPPAPEEGKSLGAGGFDINSLFGEPEGPVQPKTSRKEDAVLNPVEEDADDTYDYNKKLKVQKIQREQVHMVQPSNPSSPDITPDVPEINYN